MVKMSSLKLKSKILFEIASHYEILGDTFVKHYASPVNWRPRSRVRGAGLGSAHVLLSPFSPQTDCGLHPPSKRHWNVVFCRNSHADCEIHASEFDV